MAVILLPGINRFNDIIRSDAITTSAAIAITADWNSKIYDIGYGTFKTLYIYTSKQSSGTLEVSAIVDGNTVSSGSIDLTKGQAATAGLIKNTYLINDKGHSLQLRIAHSTLSGTFELFKMEITFEPQFLEEIV